ncbi:hypothetical protein LCGC14_2031960, partial [marine sediment metagenome]
MNEVTDSWELIVIGAIFIIAVGIVALTSWYT